MKRMCGSCRQAEVRDVWLCRRCERYISRTLSDQEAYRQELLTSMARMVRMNVSVGGRAAPVSLQWARMGDRYLDSITGKEMRRLVAGLPQARPAADALHSQRALLCSWTKLVVDEGISVEYPSDTVLGMSLFVERNLPELRVREIVGELGPKLRELTREIMQAIDTPEVRQQITVGPCIMRSGGEDCPGQVVAVFPRAVDQPPVMRCAACKAEWPSIQWLRVGEVIARKIGVV